MSAIQALILSIVEGLTEFLPISSTGHLLLTSRILAITQSEFVKSFEVIIQLGAILAVVVFFIPRFKQIIKLWKQILLAFIPTAVVGFGLYKIIKNFFFEQIWITIFMLFAGGIFILVFEQVWAHIVRKKQVGAGKNIQELSGLQAMFIGLCQAVSVVPGASRALASIYGGMFVGLSREQAVEFSFFLAVPTIFAAAALDVVKMGWSFSINEWTSLLVGFVGAFVSALIVVKFFLKFAKTNNFFVFGIYRIILAAVAYLTLIVSS